MEEAIVSGGLEPLDVEVRNPTIVLSVRLDDATVRQLRVLARERGVRISDLLREAAGALAEEATKRPGRAPTPYDIAYLTTAVGVGSITPRTMAEVKAHDTGGPWSSGPRTSVSAAS
jgi:hypothetical protein